MSILVVGVSHRSAPVEVLEQLALDNDAMAKTLDEIHVAEHISEAVVISTCNRLELYADVATFHGGVEEATSILSARTGMPLDDLTDYLYVHYDDRAISHLFQVVSGLDAMVVGESQILGQVRESYRLAQTSETTGRTLSELFQTALRVGKRSHAETNIDVAGRSLVTVGLAAVTSSPRWREAVAGRKVLVVGAGAMAALAASTVAKAAASVTISNRTFAKASRLAESVGGRAIDRDHLPAALNEVDIVISCTGASGVVLSHDEIANAMHRRGGRALGIVDLALPHDVAPAVAELPGVTLVDLARLAETEHSDASAVATEVEAVRAIVSDEVAAFAGARRAAQVAPTVVALRSMADEVVSAELKRLGGRLPNLDESELGEVGSTVRRVVDKLLHSPTVRVKELASQPDGASYETALRELFALDPRAIDAVIKPEPPAEGGAGR